MNVYFTYFTALMIALRALPALALALAMQRIHGR
jgi:hypothetical protein